MSIKFTQYLLPDGRQKQITVDRPDEIEKMADSIISRGLRFEAEMLTTGAISLTVHDPKEEDDIDIEVVANGPEVPVAIDRMITRVFNHVRR